jgi:putative transposase
MLSYKYRLKPSREQVVILERQLNLCRWTYNTFLGYCYDERKSGRGTPRTIPMIYLLTIWKERNPELNEIHSQVLQNVVDRVRLGFEGHWARKKLKMRSHTPKFKKTDDYSSLTYTQSGFKLNNSMLNLSKIGDVKIIQHRPVEGKVKRLTILREYSGKWYASFACEVEDKPIQGRLPSIGIDFGLNSLVAFDDGTKIEAPQLYRKTYEKLRRTQRIFSKKKRGSNNRLKQRIRLAKIYERETNQRKDLSFKIARDIVNKYETIYVEDLKITNMVKNKHLSKSIYDAGWGILKNNLTYMAKMSLGKTVLVNPKNTTQICSGCGVIVRKDLSVRIHSCPECGLVLDRDVNAARNILRNGIESERLELTLVGEPTSTIDKRVGVQVGSMNQEATLLVGW